MQTFRADLHVHTVLSPCASLEMSPVNIVRRAAEKGIDILGITDHNSTHHCISASKLAKKMGIYVMMGVEITTREEIHCLAYFETEEQLAEIQQYLDSHLPDIHNDPQKFGYQVIVDEEETIIREEKRLLISALDQSLEDVEVKVHSLDGLFIPAHIDKNRFSLISQLGFIPKGLKMDALELSKNVKYASILPYLEGFRNKVMLKNSDAHTLEEVGSIFSLLDMEQRSFSEFRRFLCSQELITKISA